MSATAYRLYLCLEDEQLAAIPWELLNDSEPFAQRKSTPLIRCRSVQIKSSGDLMYWPLRVLILVGAAPDSNIGADLELARIKRRLRKHDYAFDLEVVDTRQQRVVAFDDLRAKIQAFAPDAFHFIGHGGVQAAAGEAKRSYLLVYDCDQATSWKWWDRDIGLTLKNAGARLRIAYLNACRTGTSVPEVRSIAGAFLANGTQAVIAMQADVGAHAARSCAPVFYERLACGDTVDQALQEGRLKLGSADQADPYLPVLTVAAPVELILPKRDSLEQKIKTALDECEKLKQVGLSFVDRHDKRRDLVAGFYRRDIDPQKRYSAAYVRGDSLWGKTWLAWWLHWACLLQRLRSHYIVPEDGADWLEVLRSIVRGRDEVLAPRMPDALASKFYWELAQAARGVQPPFPVAPEARGRKKK